MNSDSRVPCYLRTTCCYMILSLCVSVSLCTVISRCVFIYISQSLSSSICLFSVCTCLSQSPLLPIIICLSFLHIPEPTTSKRDKTDTHSCHPRPPPLIITLMKFAAYSCDPHVIERLICSYRKCHRVSSKDVVNASDPHRWPPP